MWPNIFIPSKQFTVALFDIFHFKDKGEDGSLKTYSMLCEIFYEVRP